MECPIQSRENADLLLAYCARKLEPRTAAILERHMESCPDCRAFGDEQRAVWAALDRWDAQPVSTVFDRRLYQRIEAEEHRGWWDRAVRPWLPRDWRPAFPLAAASVLVAAVLLFRSPGPVGFPEANQAEVLDMDLERVERTLDDLEMLRQLNLMARVEAPSLQPM